MAFEKAAKDFLSKFQKDLDGLQKAIKKEGDDLVKKVKKAATSDKVVTKRKEIEKLVESKLKKFEPTINKLVHELNTNAKRAGVDLTDLEKTVRDNLATARTKLSAPKKPAPNAKKLRRRRAPPEAEIQS